MKEVVKVKLENEMDLILAHKRAMKLCELCGLSLISQTSFATAVSEIARCAIEFGKNSFLSLGIDSIGTRKLLRAIVSDSYDFSSRCDDAINYAKRLVDNIEITKAAKEFKITLKQQLSFHGTLTDNKIEGFVKYFQGEPPLSAYDELRKKNLMLQDLAEKIKDSESDYRILTDSLPLMMFAVNNRGLISYTNRWLQDFLGTIPKELSSNAWQNFIHPADYPLFIKGLTNSLHKQAPLNGQFRFKEKGTEIFLWHMISVIPLKNEKEIIQRWIGFIVDIHAQKTIEQTLRDNKGLKEAQAELQHKIIELNRSNYELEQFAHLATHDLQEPLRKLFFYSDVLKKKYSSSIDQAGVNMLNSMTSSANRMKELITDLLSYSQLQKQKMSFEQLSLNNLFEEILKDFDFAIKEKNATIEVSEFPEITGNPLRLRQLFSNLISNSLKYSKKDIPPVITVFGTREEENLIITLEDNGIGFEEEHKDRIFGLFERLHNRSEFPGTGIGLSICKRIAELHHGTVSANSIVNESATFRVVLPFVQNIETVAEI